MKSKASLWFAQIAVVALALSSGAVAQSHRPITLGGTIDDYNPFEKGGYEMHGKWLLTVYGAPASPISRRR